MVVLRSFVYTSLLCVANLAEAAEGSHGLPGSSHRHVARHLGKPRQFGQPPNAVRYASQPSASQTSSGSETSTLASITVATPSASLVSATSVQFTSAISSTASAPASNPTQASNSSTLQDIATIHSRRLNTIVNSITGDPSNISTWLADLQADGKWPDSDVDYAAGCDGRKASWPAADHWVRISTMTAAWHGGLQGYDQYVNSSTLFTAIGSGMDYWFNNDFTNVGCLVEGGTDSCPCGTPGYWNTNWYDNVILIPGLVAESCLLLNDTLTQTQLGNCSNISLRAYGAFDHGYSFEAGANILDMAKTGLDQGLLVVNVSLVSDAYRRVHDTIVVQTNISRQVDGIQSDGSFGQHLGLLYNGNYGNVFSNDVLVFETAAAGTSFEAGSESRAALETLYDGHRWMINFNAETQVLHWDLSPVGRFISSPVAAGQASSGIQTNLSMVEELGEQWNSDVLVNYARSLSVNATNANAGALLGNRMFFDNDYMVTRGSGYVTSLKMYSRRTRNTECTNSQNLLGFHLADGVVYTYLHGDEYEDIAAAWDWNLIPGITVDYNATVLDCAHTKYVGVEPFVGGVSDGQVGVAAMRYTNPISKSFSWQKTWFFLEDDVQYVMIANISSKSNAPIFSVLDQRRFREPGVFVNGAGTFGGNFTDPHTMWHGDVGYEFNGANGTYELSVEWGNRTGDWSSTGVWSGQETVNLFSAWLHHKDLNTPISYAVYPAVDYGTFTLKRASTRLTEIQNNASLSALLDEDHDTVFGVFWEESGGSFTFTDKVYGSMKVESSAHATFIYRMDTGNLTVADPSRKLPHLTFKISVEDGLGGPCEWGGESSVTAHFDMTRSDLAGNSVSQILNQ
ncbi:polysaccharide lyase family 8 protein [Suillus clintonianus]|uniref:polysaccharide lyase family 8 protein n=1 Tax=Suillus clintonianus TaxID=1904413 RepID=UPI001B861056|nr:polysaccharide lyase family 8 protein [Suillus clintonianus]KAG2129781.1 polysaccharide lyase family 8 protein [Suillus clintonianus]